ncbi:hypothetical protein [Streptomyces azureus]|uniref:Cytochrome P450 n=1 Tax=Streptomyces azureus TaxID=146537 RepID=A0A0K8PT77_STRAJ|nr:cytochrome P450 [Streptomyces azureus]
MDGTALQPPPGSLAFTDQPDHNRPRKAVAGAFTAGSMKRQIISTSGGAEAADRAKGSLYGWLTQTIRSRAHSTGGDVYSLLGAAVAAGDISDTEAVGLAGPLQTGGEAVIRNCGQMLCLLLTGPSRGRRGTSGPGRATRCWPSCCAARPDCGSPSPRTRWPGAARRCPGGRGHCPAPGDP